MLKGRGQRCVEPRQEQPRVDRIRVAGLGEAVARGPGPPGLGGQHDEPVEVGHDPLVADRGVSTRRRRHPVVEAEVVERGGEPDARRPA